MRTFNEIQEILGEQPSVKKIYLLGSTGAGKTSLVRSILGTEKHSFPTITQTRTTVSNTEYFIQEGIDFKTTLIIKKENDIKDAIEDLVQEAIQRGIENKKYATNDIDSIALKLEESSDEKFRLRYILPPEFIREKARDIKENILTKVDDLDDESKFSSVDIQQSIGEIVNSIFENVIDNFSKIVGRDYVSFLSVPFYIEGIKEKDEFIMRNKEILKNEYPSILPLVEYTRIQGYLLADWIDLKEGFVLIDGEGIGHSLQERIDTLSSRHYDYFKFCNSIVLVEKGDDPFISGGKAAIESIILNGYKDKFRLVFSKIDKIEGSNKDYYLKKRVDNLKIALKEDDIDLHLPGKQIYKLGNLNQNIPDSSKSEIKKLLKDIFSQLDVIPEVLEYDFSGFLYDLNTDSFVDDFSKRIDKEHWTVIKALSRRLSNTETEYKHLKPLSMSLIFIMKDINLFLKRKDDLDSSIISAQNLIKQRFSQKLIIYIFNELISKKKHLWQQAYEERGEGSHTRRKKFIIEDIIKNAMPRKDSVEFERFRGDMKSLILKSGAKELAIPERIFLKNVEIEKIYGEKSFSWKLSKDTNILIGQNGSGKSTILKIINACINSKKEIIQKYGNPYVKLTISKEYIDGSSNDVEITNQSVQPNIRSILINTFDNGEESLDFTLNTLAIEFTEYQRKLKTISDEQTKTIRKELDTIFTNILTASPEILKRFQELKIQQNKIENAVFEKVSIFREVVNQFLNQTDKELIIDDREEPLLVNIKSEEKKIRKDFLSSGEKQLLIILLTVLVYADEICILLLDEPEISLHVEWQYILLDKIKEINTNIQIISATHNPVIMLNRKPSEVGVIKSQKDIIETENIGTETLDVSTVLIKYFGLPSILGKDMQAKVKDFNELQLRTEDLSDAEKEKMNELREALSNSLVGEIINDKKYLKFMEFVRDHRNLNFKEYEALSDIEIDELLKDFGDFLND